MFSPGYSLKPRHAALGQERTGPIQRFSEMQMRCPMVRRPVRYNGSESARSSAGFSLIETLCAVLVLAVALIGMVQAITAALGSTKDSELQTVAALFAAGQVETIRAEGDLRDGTTEGECGEGLSLYRWQQTIAPAGIDGLHDVTVAIESTGSGKTIYELKTLLFEVPSDLPTSSTKSRKDPASQRRRNSPR